VPLDDLLALAVASPLGPLRLRRETAQDDAFRFALFRESHPELALLPLDPAMKELVLRQQFQAQAAGYAAQYPDVLPVIVERDGAPVGRLALATVRGGLHVADIAVAPSLRGQGVGTALLVALHDAASPLRLHVATTNAGAQRLYARLGFAIVARSDTAVEMEWA
jgi:ribosomal protein S18 acetylase RimI-like enzyme